MQLNIVNRIYDNDAKNHMKIFLDKLETNNRY